MTTLPPFPPPPAGFAPPSAPGLTLTPCRPADLPFLHRLYRSTREDEMAATGWDAGFVRTFCDQQFAAQHRDWIGRFPAAAFLLIRRGRDPVGRLYVDAAPAALHVIDISLTPAVRGRGFGTALLTALIGQAAAGGRIVTLAVDPLNQRARSLYRRLGFRETGRSPSRLTLSHPGDSNGLAQPGAPMLGSVG
ncbi:Ribosomal protein S18 acetylase RimI [Methylobacterium sp. 174MFSha1.1]|uniref:GNAT family N-acetyltransferase n=1 Tax=Methylobacterium sp. 174MFSha1.1 TaxID=1502749 RepID=UPI0008DF275F|nr:N-acetyltransferase [Methylobacterium sp. 174MFSha1.1]SFV08849.1 Ribosomal protein S18 acetylase RimI [Methylobacterium sp. 174MFSha1.1]